MIYSVEQGTMKKPAMMQAIARRILSSVVVSLLLLATSQHSISAEEFWSSLDSGQAANLGLADDNLSTQFTRTQQGAQHSLQLTQTLSAQNSMSFRYSQALHQRDFALGFTNNNLSVSYMSGSGEDYLEIGGQYTGIDPYLFHGGWDQKFEYNGYALDYSLASVGHLQYGQATVSADGLDDRTAKYLEWSNNSVYARATSFSRGNKNIGHGIDAGYDFGRARLSVQTMDLDYGRSQQRLRLQFDGKQSRQYWIDLSTHSNPLYRDNDDTRLMFTFKTLLGTDPSSYVSYADEPSAVDPQGTKKTKKRGWGRAVLIGVGAAAVAAASSSGSEAADQQTRARSQNDAAFDVLNGINPRSIRENREYGGWVFLNPDGSYSSTAPVAGEAASVTLPDLNVIIPQGSRATASYHTHAAFDPNFDNENFSPTDLRNDREVGLDGYLATPGGQFKLHDIATDTVITLGSIATE